MFIIVSSMYVTCVSSRSTWMYPTLQTQRSSSLWSSSLQPRLLVRGSCAHLTQDLVWIPLGTQTSLHGTAHLLLHSTQEPHSTQEGSSTQEHQCSQQHHSSQQLQPQAPLPPHQAMDLFTHPYLIMKRNHNEINTEVEKLFW